MINKKKRVLLTGIARSCGFCGKEVRVLPSRAKRYKTSFCNKSCEVNSRQRVEWVHPNGECSQYVDGGGRMRVWVPNHPRSYSDGYLLRSIVHWEYYNGVSVPEGFDVHHEDHDKLNDSEDNLHIIEHAEHSRLHNKKERVGLICSNCATPFWRVPCRVRYDHTYCSQKCYEKRGKNK